MEPVTQLGAPVALLVLAVCVVVVVVSARVRVGPLRWVSALLNVAVVALGSVLLAGDGVLARVVTSPDVLHGTVGALVAACGVGFLSESLSSRRAEPVVAAVTLVGAVVLAVVPPTVAGTAIGVAWAMVMVGVAARLRGIAERQRTSVFAPLLRAGSSGMLVMVLLPVLPWADSPLGDLDVLLVHAGLAVAWSTLATPRWLTTTVGSARALLRVGRSAADGRDPRLAGDEQLAEVVEDLGAEAAVLLDRGLPVASTGGPRSRDRLVAMLGASEPDELGPEPVALGQGHWMLVRSTRRGWLAAEFRETVDLIGTDDAAVLTTAAERFGDALERADARRRDADAIASLRAADRMRDDFLATLSHELRTPLTSIRGFSQVLTSGRLGAEQQADLLGRIAANATELEDMVAGLLDLTAVRARRLPERVAPYQLGDLVDRVVARSGHLLARVEVAVAVPPVEVVTDGTAVSTILEQLFDNIDKFTPSGTAVSVTGESHVDAVHVVVADDGPGVPPEIRGSVFEPFVRGGEMLTRRTRGVGIGLSIAAELARQLDGRLELDDAPIGTCVRLVLPLVHPAADHERPPGDLHAHAAPITE